MDKGSRDDDSRAKVLGTPARNERFPDEHDYDLLEDALVDIEGAQAAGEDGKDSTEGGSDKDDEDRCNTQPKVCIFAADAPALEGLFG